MKEWEWECINSFCGYRLWILLSYLHCSSLQNAIGKSAGKGLLLYRHIHNPVKNLRFSFLAKKLHPRCFPRFWMRLESSIIWPNLYNFMKVYKLFIVYSALVYYFLHIAFKCFHQSKLRLWFCEIFRHQLISGPIKVQWIISTYTAHFPGTVDHFYLHNPFSITI